MLNPTHAKHAIEHAITAFGAGDMADCALKLLDVLGYASPKRLTLTKDELGQQLADHSPNSPNRARFNDWRDVPILLVQITDDEIRHIQAAAYQSENYHSYVVLALELTGETYTRTALAQMTREINKLFAMPALLLVKYGNHLSLAITDRRPHKREPDKTVLEKVTLIKDICIPTYPQPLPKGEGSFSPPFSERKMTGEVHRAHLDILFDLSFDELRRVHQFTNFNELHAAWQQTLDTRALNKQFYQKLFDWYVWALQAVKFPQIRPEADKVPDPVHQSESLIRLLTRLLFVWFMKEKGLIPEVLFDRRTLQTMLNGFQGPDGEQTIYYTAILQNLFFATLNQPIAQRKVLAAGFNPREYGDPLVYRHAGLFREPGKLLSYFEGIPFLNGGLFECLDQKKDAEHPAEIRLDGFSSKPEKQPKFPDKFFFGQYAGVDVSRDDADQKKQRVTVHGLIDILQQYKFTIEENTPVEEEVALDPELLGKVFENLLASYNPETQTTARKQTGSFYTPREIVNYMVDESLLAYLKQAMLSETPGVIGVGEQQADMFGNSQRDGQLRLEQRVQRSPWRGKETELETALRDALSYSERPLPFDAADRRALIAAINRCTLLDPACGSGAFPMGALQKLVHLLHRLDPDNRLWKAEQRERLIGAKIAELQQDKATAARLSDDKVREQAIRAIDDRLQEIEDVFSREHNFDDYARKLYLIQNCIHGVDIQPIATQIAKLRCFIALIIDQKPQPDQPNFGLRPLPNLDFKMVTANTLIAAPQAEHHADGLFAAQVDPFFTQFEQLTGEYFTTAEPAAKNRLRHKIEHLVKERTATSIQQIERNFKTALDARYNAAKAKQKEALIAEKEQEVRLWQSYPNLFKHEAVGFFEPRYFFPNVTEGFDIVIGNPPYVQIQKLSGTQTQKDLQVQAYRTFNKTGDIYCLFYERGQQLLASKGTLIFITNSMWLRTEYGAILKDFFLNHVTLTKLLDLSDCDLFSNAAVLTAIVQFINRKPEQLNAKGVRIRKFQQQELDNLPAYFEREAIPLNDFTVEQPWTILDKQRFEIKHKIDQQGTPLKDWNIKIYRGILTGFNDAFIIDGTTRNALVKADPKSVDVLKPMLRGRNIKAYYADFDDLWLIATHNGYTDHTGNRIPPIDVEHDYPAIKAHLDQYWDQLKRRQDKGNTPYNLRNCAYYQEYEKEKIIYPEITKYMGFVYDPEGYYYSNNKTFIMTGERLKFLVAFLNSRLFKEIFREYFPELLGNVRELRKVFFEILPIPKISEAEQRPFELLVDQILAAKQQNPAADTRAQEAEIDRLVYGLYGLTAEEIALVEGRG